MKLGIVGMGRMGKNMAIRLIKGGHKVVIYDRTPEKALAMKDEGAIVSCEFGEFLRKLGKPQIVWLMLPAGDVTEAKIRKLTPYLKKGAVLVEGGNSHYSDDIRRYTLLRKKGVRYVDAGVSGGVWGGKIGYCTMVGGDKAAFKIIEPALRTLAPEGGYMYCGPTGAGHYVKMIHNAIEYGLMQAYAEGFEILKASQYGSGLKLGKIAALWNKGSVVRSWLLELLEPVLSDEKALDEIQGYVEDSGEARWAVKEAVDAGVSADVITAALYRR
ncbi:MAG TPA: decarboxylating 6-phosphogluconate dehydrogenase, partial [Candidatus Goldiibacteriota bacterium]|nr:decarboxylating 6-phosphogluconate dehydrogenase [Candidatus Goldiibacteriota bacterium]